MHEPISVLYVDERAYFLPNISNIVVFGTDNPLSQFKKINILFTGSLNFQLRKEVPKELQHERIFVFHVDERAYFLPDISNILLF